MTKILTVALGLYSYGCSEVTGDPDIQLNPVLRDAGGNAFSSGNDASTPPASNNDASTPPASNNDASTPPASSIDASTPPPARSDASSPPAVGNDAAMPDSSTPLADSGPMPDGSTPHVVPGSSCLSGITSYDKTGPFKYTAKPQGVIKFWVPEVPAGCKVPVVHLANGTGASCSNYQQVLNQLASYGFLAACYEDANTGAGTQGLKAFETAFEKFPNLADYKLGSMGHSQGGQAAFTVLQLTEAKFGDKAIYSGLAMQPASGFGTQPSGGSWQSLYKKIKSPMFMFSGTADVLVSEGWVQQAFDALDDGIEAYWYSGVGSTHIPTPEEHTVTVAVSWFRWKLLGDKAACEYFKKLPDGDKWDKRKAQNEKPCQ